MKMFTWIYAQDEVTHQKLRIGSKKHVLSLPKGPSSKAAAISTRGAYAEYVSTEKWRPACALARRSAPARRREAAFSLRSHFGEGGPAKAGNAAGGFFQQTPLDVSSFAPKDLYKSGASITMEQRTPGRHQRYNLHKGDDYEALSGYRKCKRDSRSG
jgi:hypothetical protein